MPTTNYVRLVADPSSNDGTTALGSARNPLRVASTGKATYRVIFDAIALANNKYMALLFNTNTTYDVVVQSIRVIQANLDAVTGVITELELRRVSAFTTGTAVTPLADDPETDTLPSGVSADHNSSAVTDVTGGLISRIHRTGEEMVLAADNLLLAGALYPNTFIYQRRDGERGITLSGTTAANRGIAVKCATNTTAGDMNFEIVFTVEPS